MEYAVKALQSAAELRRCPEFLIDHFQWRCLRRPPARGRMGFLPGSGLLVELECAERDPLRLYALDQSPVCRDSALEAFFAFDPTPGGPPTTAASTSTLR
mgnify:CR=1 FL=1